jgi:hypothetical protein
MKSLISTSLENDLIERLERMNIRDLIDTLWWVLQQENKSNFLFESLQEQIQK